MPPASGEAEGEHERDKKEAGANKVPVGDKRGPMVNPGPDAQKPMLPTQREVVVAQNGGTEWQSTTAPSPVSSSHVRPGSARVQ